ncbi:MAG TPA: YfhO family protein, partial [Leptospiraceae bacterium]|nr:YfhO family protein [Leptospiraceae bacterium]
YFGFHAYLIFTVISSCFFAYLLAFRLTQSFAGALLAGLIFGWSGSITAQVTMAVIPVSSSWLPLLTLSHLLIFEQPNSRARFLFNAAITYLSVTSGSPQTVFFNFLFAYLFLAFKIRYPRIPFLNRKNGGAISDRTGNEKLELKPVYTVLLSTGAGILLSSVSLFPLIELMKYSDRSVSIDKAAFNSYHFSFSDLIKIPFPYSFGGLTENSLFRFSYIYPSTAIDNFHEHQRYMGIISFIIAFIGWKNTEDRRLKAFLASGFIFYLLYSLGTETPLGRLIYGIPVISKFRGPNRHILELTLIVSILAAFGIRRIAENGRYAGPKERFHFLYFTFFFILALFTAVLSVPDLKSRYSAVNFFSFYGNNLLTFQISVLLICSIIYYFFYNKFSARTVFIFHFIISMDFLVTARHQDWYCLSQKKETEFTELEKKVQRLTADSGTFTKFIIPGHEVRDYYSVPNTMHENLNDNRKVNLNIRGYSIYSPLAMKDSARMIQLTEGDPALGGLFNYKYTALVHSSPVSSVAKPWKAGTCPNNIAYLYSEKESDVLFAENIVPSGGKVTLITSTDCLEGNLHADEILGKARFYSSENKMIEKIIRKKDTVPNFAACSLVHENLYRKFRFDRTKCGFTAETKIELPENFEIRKISFISEKGILIVYSVSAGEGKNRIFHYPVNSEILKTGSRTLLSESGLTVYENSSARPEFYFAESVSARTHEEIYNDFINKKYFELGKFGVYAENATAEQELKNSKFSPSEGRVSSFERNHHSVSLLTESSSSQFLVLNHSFYPGWKAYIDGQETKIYRTNYIMRGISVPEGRHKIEFKYRPSAFYLGLTISFFTFFIMILFFFLGKWKKTHSAFDV